MAVEVVMRMVLLVIMMLVWMIAVDVVTVLFGNALCEGDQ